MFESQRNGLTVSLQCNAGLAVEAASLVPAQQLHSQSLQTPPSPSPASLCHHPGHDLCPGTSGVLSSPHQASYECRNTSAKMAGVLNKKKTIPKFFFTIYYLGYAL